MNGHILRRGTKPSITALTVLTLQLIVASLATAQSYYCLPSCSATDARFLSLSGSSFRSVGGDQITINLAAPSGSDSIVFEIFDGETSGLWDAGSAPLTFTLFADPSGNGDGTQRVGQWSGSVMSDSAWYRIAMAHSTASRAESQAYFYVLRVQIATGDTVDLNDIEDDAEDARANVTWSNFKIRSLASISTKQFAFCAPLFSVREAAIVYPNFPALTNPTYDGTWTLLVDVPVARPSFEVWDGDMDFGSYNGLAMDTDDANTSSLTVPHWAGTSSVAEGVATSPDRVRDLLGNLTGTLGTGSPADDNLSLTYRRSPSVYYDVVDPNGATYRNSNPSGNQEWERFVIGTRGATNVDTTVNFLPQGIYEVRISGMDMHNINAWRYGNGIVGVTSTGGYAEIPDATCPTSARSFGRGASALSVAEVASNGELYSWGKNSSGVLGDGSTSNRTTPVRVVKGDYPGDTYLGDQCGGVANVAVSEKQSIAVLHDGTVYAWGDNTSGLLGVNSSTTTITAPKRVVKGSYPGTTYFGDLWTRPITRVAAGHTHLAAVSSAGFVYAWGKNDVGQCGDATTTDRTSPVRVLKGAYNGTTYLGDNPANPIIDVVAGYRATYALAADGTVYAWGRNNVGQLGDGTTTDRTSPVRVVKGAYTGTTYLGDASDKITAIAAMSEGCIALSADGLVYSWGSNLEGQLGDNSTTSRSTPVRVLKGAYAGTTNLGDSTANRITHIAAGGAHCLAMSSRGQVFAWGDNANGILGDNTRTDRPTPIRVLKGYYTGTTYLGDGSTAITALAAGLEHSLAIAGAATTSYAWGRGTLGRLGDGNSSDNRTPIIVAQGERPLANESSNPDDGIAPPMPATDDETLSIDDIMVPSNAESIVLSLSSKHDVNADFHLYGADGNHVASPLLGSIVAAGTRRVSISIPGDMPSGLYFVNVNTGAGSVTRHFLLTR